MIEKVTSIQMLKQIGTANRPILSFCRTNNGIKPYYLKYARTTNEVEGLVAELVCYLLAKKLHIETPEHVYATVGQHSISQNIIHREHLGAGIVTVGSAQYPPASVKEITKLDFVINKHSFNSLKNPLQILRIGIFDCWVGNFDRKEDNYNLFLSTDRQQELIIFDHFEAFNNISNNPNTTIETDIHVINSGFLISKYALKMLHFLNKTKLKDELEHTYKLIESIDIDATLNNLYETFPDSWNVSSKTISYIKDFLTNKDRLRNLKESLEYYIKYYT